MNQKKSFYDTIPEDIEKMGYNSEKFNFILQSVGTNLQVLDIGCNDGLVGAKLMEKNNHIFGIDIVKREVLAAKKRGIEAIVLDIENEELPYKANFFDVVILTDVIEHVFDTDLLLSKIYKVLKPGGKLLITTPNVASLGRRLMLLLGYNPFLEYSTKYIDFAVAPVGHIRYYTLSDLARQLDRNKFRKVVVKGDRVNFILFSNALAAKILPSFSVNIHCVGIK